MLKFRWLVNLLLCLAALAVAAESENITWQTLDGKPPLVIARGGFSGIFPDSSEAAYALASRFSVSNMISWCDVQLTKDGVGVCLNDLDLKNSTNVQEIFENRKTSRFVNNVNTTGWFSSDFTREELLNLTLTQGMYARPPDFDYEYPILMVEDVSKIPIKPNSTEPRDLWLNIQYHSFYEEQGLNIIEYTYYQFSRPNSDVKYVSSAEIAFLEAMAGRKKPITPPPPKFIFKFLEKSEIEYSTKHSYGSVSKNLEAVKEFADGILVPKSYIWPVDSQSYLKPHTNLVLEAHKAGLQVFVYGITNDYVPVTYDFNYDPVAEYLAFIDNGNFSVDGVLSDFPITPSAAIDCFSHMENSPSAEKKFDVITHEGGTGVYAGCTDLAYKSAVNAGADIIDCPVQMTKDGVLICLGSIDLMKRTSAAFYGFQPYWNVIPELGNGVGIYTFDLTLDQISTLKPEMIIPDGMEYNMMANPKVREAGKFTTLWGLVQSMIASKKNSSSHTPGLWITIEHAAYLDEKQGIDKTAAVFDVLRATNYNNLTERKAIIHSSEKQVLVRCMEQYQYECAYEPKEDIRLINNSALLDIKSFAHSLVVGKSIIFSENADKYLIKDADVVEQLHLLNFKIYAKLFRNEFMYQSWDFFSDPYVEINTFIEGRGIDGIITDFPGTAVNYRSKNRCLRMSNKPNYMRPIQPGELLKLTRNL